ncbi:unnamed protein product [Darwinula stevensoni]|uniref:rhomboid protease n=1 Tax=Darwinula stevensoni TaxID=69355 RepID=A0A7R9ADJ6_9CRUS|nr:unnamed protein product [Darwinula stevensoni]CAG0901380.1 unnamed protein product [Darwinula stevensoni]
MWSVPQRICPLPPLCRAGRDRGVQHLRFRLERRQPVHKGSRGKGFRDVEPAKERSSLAPFAPPEDGGRVGLRDLWKPAGFTVVTCGVSYVGATIWQYENMRNQAHKAVRSAWRPAPRPKHGEWRRGLNEWWSGLTPGQRVFWPIAFANGLVFLAWRVPSLQPAMIRYFTSSPTSRSVCWPMLLSTFSHYSAIHVFLNMYVLHSFSSSAVYLMGKEQFVGFYVSAGVTSSFVSYLHKAAFGIPGISLGAVRTRESSVELGTCSPCEVVRFCVQSGAILGVLGYVCTMRPDILLGIAFVPNVTFSAGSAVKAMLAFDTCGVVMRWKFFDHAAHLGGMLFGVGYAAYGDRAWRKREGIMDAWHAVRQRFS